MSQHKIPIVRSNSDDEECKGDEQADSSSSKAARIDSDAASAASRASAAAVDNRSVAAMEDETTTHAAPTTSSASSSSSAAAVAPSASSVSSSSAAAAASSSSATSSSSSVAGPSTLSSFEAECAAAEERRRERLEGLRAADLMAVLPLVFDQLEAEGLPRMLPDLQSLIAQYAVPHRVFVGATRDPSKPSGWRIEQMDDCGLKWRLVRMLLNRHHAAVAAGVISDFSPPRHPCNSPSGLMAASIEELLDYISAPISRPPVYRDYSALPFELLFELGGVDTIIGRVYQSAAARQMLALREEDKTRAQEPFMARERDLKPFLQLLFQSREIGPELGLPAFDFPTLDLIASYAATPFPPHTPLAALLTFGHEPLALLHRLYPRGYTLKSLGPIHTDADLERIVGMLSGGQLIQYLVRGGGWDQFIDVSAWLSESEEEKRRAHAQPHANQEAIDEENDEENDEEFDEEIDEEDETE